MEETKFFLRQLMVQDAPLFQAIRLEALSNSPESFGAVFEEESLHPLTWFENRLTRNFVIGVFDNQNLCGITGYCGQDGPKNKHKGAIWGVYVQPRYRCQGAARLMIEFALEKAGQHFEQIHLTVNSTQSSARRLYETLGFTEYGYEKHAFKYQGGYSDEIHMVKFLHEV